MKKLDCFLLQYGSNINTFIVTDVYEDGYSCTCKEWWKKFRIFISKEDIQNPKKHFLLKKQYSKLRWMLKM